MSAVARLRHAAQFRQFIQAETGIQLPESKEAMIAARLRPRVSALGLPDVDAYFRHLFEENGLPGERLRITELITTNKTDFFREKAHYTFLWTRMIPEALKSARPGGPVAFRFWSAAASTGAEAWSAAMVLAEAQARRPELDWTVLGTDISPRVLATARRAIYPEAELKPVPKEMRDRYAMIGRDSAGASLRRVVPELRRRVRFEEMNLMDRSYPVEREFDAIFLRNVLIYFDPPTQARVVGSVASHLRDGGYLVVGHTESMIVRHTGLTQIAPGVFERRGSVEVLP